MMTLLMVGTRESTSFNTVITIIHLVFIVFIIIAGFTQVMNVLTVCSVWEGDSKRTCSAD